MNAVEIADAVSTLVEQPFDRDNFPFEFLEAFGNKETTLKKLRSRKGQSRLTSTSISFNGSGVGFRIGTKDLVNGVSADSRERGPWIAISKNGDGRLKPPARVMAT